jgi:hypothetical protein
MAVYIYGAFIYIYIYIYNFLGKCIFSLINESIIVVYTIINLFLVNSVLLT